MSAQTEYRETDDAQPETDETTPLEMAPPEVKGGFFGSLITYWRWRRAKKKRHKKASKGYVEWYLIDDTFPEPKFVKPESKSGGIPEVKHDGQRYLFPRNAAVMNKKSGMWTFVHKKGGADPANLRSPDKYAISPDALQEYLEMRLSSSPPGLLDKLDLDTSQLLTYMIIAIIGYGFVSQIMSGGLF